MLRHGDEHRGVHDIILFTLYMSDFFKNQTVKHTEVMLSSLSSFLVVDFLALSLALPRDWLKCGKILGFRLCEDLSLWFHSPDISERLSTHSSCH